MLYNNYVTRKQNKGRRKNDNNNNETFTECGILRDMKTWKLVAQHMHDLQ